MSLPWIVNESACLAALAEARILDTPPQYAFDRLVLEATRACATPVGLISFVGNNRQWFKAKIGFAPCETPLSQSVCKYTLDHSGLLIIPDLTADPHTRDNSLVTGEPHIRFYAGAKISASDDTAIGSLCVIDLLPRPSGLTSKQIATLESLAKECSMLLAMLKDVPANPEQILLLYRIKRLEITIKTQRDFIATIPDPDNRERAEGNLIDMVVAVTALREMHEHLLNCRLLS